MLLEKLSNAVGVGNYEDEVRNIILEEIKGYVDEIKVDRMGNIIAIKNKEASGKNIVLSAHMDEVGLIIHNIDDKGFLNFYTIGGIDPNILNSKAVIVGEKKIKGVIGSKAIHLQKDNEKGNAIPVDSLYIDIGANSKDQALKYVSLGDCVAFDEKFIQFGDNKIKGKAFDDRVGCFTIIELLKSDIKSKLTACFVVQEEIAIRGSKVVANRIDADIVINLEGTISADTLVENEKDYVTTLGKGPAISLIDAKSVYLKEYIDLVVNVANKYNIPYQYRKSSMGGTDSHNYHLSKGGTPVINLSVPCRYIHSPISVADKSDIENLKILTQRLIEELS